MDWREQRRQWREQRRVERHEKYEKGEKGEKPEKGHGNLTGPIIGGGILVWLGVLVFLQSLYPTVSANFGGYFLVGIGVLIVLGGLVAKTSSGRPLLGYLIGGLVLIVLGAFAFVGFSNYIGALFLIFLGVLVFFFAYSGRRRSPPPAPPASM